MPREAGQPEMVLLPGVAWRRARGGPVAQRPAMVGQKAGAPVAPVAGRASSGRLPVRPAAANEGNHPPLFGHLAGPDINVREEVRLLPRPLHRYSDPGSGLQDGAIFAFATNGTNPDCLIVIELDGKELSRAVWKYAPVRMTVAQLSVRLDQKEVWSVPYVYAPAPGTLAAFDAWLFFFDTFSGAKD